MSKSIKEIILEMREDIVTPELVARAIEHLSKPDLESIKNKLGSSYESSLQKLAKALTPYIVRELTSPEYRDILYEEMKRMMDREVRKGSGK